jgi:hypothetical protein
MADRETPGTFPPNLDLTVPSVARMYDYVLQGKDNFEVDRKTIDAMLVELPEIFQFCHDNRRFLARAVEYVAGRGVDQFLDLGAGLPTVDNTHQVAQRARPGARVVYVDNDPIVLAHGRAILAENPDTTVITADLRDTDAVLDHPDTTRLLDLDRPVCVMLVSLLHCIPDADDPFGIVRRLMDRLPSGSAVIFSHIVSDDPEAGEWLTQRVLAAGTEWGRVRSPEEVAATAEGLDLVSPSADDGGTPILVDCATWRVPGTTPLARPADPEQRMWEHAGVAVKP